MILYAISGKNVGQYKRALRPQLVPDTGCGFRFKT